MKSFIAFVSILFLMAGLVFCTDLSMLSFYTEPALFPFNTVAGVTEDSRDCLYFASQSGLIKYNGVSFETYPFRRYKYPIKPNPNYLYGC